MTVLVVIDRYRCVPDTKLTILHVYDHGQCQALRTNKKSVFHHSRLFNNGLQTRMPPDLEIFVFIIIHVIIDNRLTQLISPLHTDMHTGYNTCYMHARSIIVGHYMCASNIVYVHAQDDDFASSPLGMACSENQLQVVKVLIENGAMVNYRNKVCLN